MSEPHGPLQGVKVVACSTAQAGTVPYMLMADLGAEVIKIEVPGIGDNSRGSTVLPGMPSTYFETNNRGVKSVTLNLKEAAGRDILKKLVATAEEGSGYLAIQNSRPQTIGYGLADSPLLQLAWIAEKVHEWTDLPVDRDQLLTNVSLYWLTGTAGSAARIERVDGLTLVVRGEVKAL